MWETIHLFSRYGKTTRVQSESSNEKYVSAYSSVNAANDSLTVILVNRSLNSTQTVNLESNNFSIANGNYTTKQLQSLPSTETFVSATNNGLSTGIATIVSDSLTVKLPALSTTAIILQGSGTSTGIAKTKANLQIKLYPNPVTDDNIFAFHVGENIMNTDIEVYNSLGVKVYSKYYQYISSGINIPCMGLPKGIYTVKLISRNNNIWTARFVKM